MNTSIDYILADDDAVYRELTIQQLSNIPNLHCLAVCEDALQANAAIAENLPHLLVLDVEMPGLTGIQLAKSLTQIPMIIFISSHSNYAADAFEVDAIDFLVKPVPIHRLMRAIEKARHLQELKNSVAANEGFKKHEEDSFFIKEKNSFVKIHHQNVLYVESLGDFVNIYLTDGEKKIALVNMKSLEQQLPSSEFVRVARNFMVNKSKITAVDNSHVAMGKIQLPMGKAYAENALNAIIGKNVIKRFI
jgi:two-component system LytT family response regulator